MLSALKNIILPTLFCAANEAFLCPLLILHRVELVNFPEEI